MTQNNYLGDKTANGEMLKIFTLGRFAVCHGDTKVSSDLGRSKKMWELFMFLITNREKPATPENIADTLWADNQYANPSGAVKNFVYRLRQKISPHQLSPSGSFIISAHGCYSCNFDYPHWLDIEEFEKLCREAAVLAAKEPQRACDKYCQAVGLYGGDYLPEFSYSDWLMPHRYHYRRLFIDAVINYTALLKQQELYHKVTEECEKAIAVDCFEEEFHLIYIDALLALRKVSQARAHYEHVSSLFYHEFGSKPSQEMQSRYSAIRRQGDNTEVNFIDVRDMLLERDEAEGPLFCERDFFRILCRLEKRRADREEKNVHLGLLTIRNISSLVPGLKDLKESMDRLNEFLSAGLRKGDVFTVWKQGQYAILLPGTEAHQAEEVVKRLHEKYIKDFEGNNPLPLTCTVIPVASSACI